MNGQLLKRKDHWLVRVFAGRNAAGKRIYVNQKVHGGKRQAQSVLTDLLNRRDNGQLNTSSKESLDTYLDEWLRTVVAVARRRRTHHEYTDTLKRYVRPHLGALPLAKIRPADVQRMVAALHERGLASRTVRKAHSVLRNALQQGVKDGRLRENPAWHTTLPAETRRERVTVPVAKLPDVITAALKDERFGAYWLLLLLGGFRPEEALALRWSDIHGDAALMSPIV